eukprot:1569326-Amphidinium_carterae.1
MYPRRDSQGAACKKWNHPWAEFRAPNLKGQPGAAFQMRKTFKLQSQLGPKNLKGQPGRCTKCENTALDLKGRLKWLRLTRWYTTKEADIIELLQRQDRQLPPSYNYRESEEDYKDSRRLHYVRSDTKGAYDTTYLTTL